MALAVLIAVGGATDTASAKPKKADLTVSSVTGQDTSGGDVMFVSHTVKNKGKKKARASKSKLVLSSDKKAGASDTVLEPGAAIPRLKPKKSFESETVTVAIPADTPPGSYFVVACADATKKVKEKSEKNNCKASSAVEITDITAPAAPTNLATSPGSPALDSTPIVTGNAEPFAAVQIFRNADCFGPPAVTGGTGENGNFLISVSVALSFTTSLSVRAVDSSGNGSPCSSAITYQQAAAESEPNDTPGQANEITEFPTKLQAAITPVDDQDWYAVEVTAGKPTVVAETRGANGAACGTTVETILELYAPDGTTLLGQDDDDGDGSCSLIDGRGPDSFAANLAPGRYFVSVRFLANSGTTPYQLTVDNVAAESEPNGTSGAADALSGDPGRVGGSISPVGDNDWYAVTVTADRPIILAETSTPTCDGSGDPILELFAPNGTTQLVYNDDGGVGNCSLIDGRGLDAGAANLAPGTYFLRVRTFNNLTSTPYTLTVETLAAEAEPNDSSVTATPLAGNPSRAGAQISPAGDQDWYAIDIPAGDSVIFAETSTPVCNDDDTVLELYAPDGTILLDSNDDGPGIGACSRIDGRGPNSGARGLAPGTYYLRVREFGNDSTTRYTLTARTSP